MNSLAHTVPVIAFVLITVLTFLYQYGDTVNFSKWIVMTSARPPTVDIKNLPIQPRWNYLVDTKTPRDWRHPSGLFTSVSKQDFTEKFIRDLLINGHDHSRTTQALNGLEEILDWCAQVNGTNGTGLPLDGDFLQYYANHTGLQQKKNTVLVLVSNQPWRPAIIGLLQRMYSPFFKTTIFCGTWVDPSTDPGLLPPIEPLYFVNVTFAEMRNGARYGYCVPRVRDLEIPNVTGYYFVADDTLFNFWHELPMDKLVVPREVYNIRTFWDPGAIMRSYRAFETRYKYDPRFGASWQQHKEQLQRAYPNDNVTDHYLHEPRAVLADFFYVPTHTIEYFGNLLQVLMDNEVFVEVAVAKVMDGMNYTRGGEFSYLWGERPIQWLYYNSSIIGVHPIKLSSVHTDLDYRTKYCETVVKTFCEEIYGWKTNNMSFFE